MRHDTAPRSYSIADVWLAVLGASGWRELWRRCSLYEVGRKGLQVEGIGKTRWDWTVVPQSLLGRAESLG